jgi:hypothetical protein
MNNKLNNPSALSHRRADSECDIYPGRGYRCLTSCPFPFCEHDMEIENKHYHKRKLFHRRKKKLSRFSELVASLHRSMLAVSNTIGRSLCRAGVITPRLMPLVYRLSGNNVYTPLDGRIGVFTRIGSLPDRIIRLFVYCMGRPSNIKSNVGLTYSLHLTTQRQANGKTRGDLDVCTAFGSPWEH